MHQHPELPPSGRTTFLAVLLLTLFGAGCFVFCMGLFGHLFIEALLVVGVIGGVGMCHYLLWGRSLSAEVEAEREPEDNDEPWAPGDGPPDERIRPKRW